MADVVDDGSCIYVPENFSFEERLQIEHITLLLNQIDGEDLDKL